MSDLIDVVMIYETFRFQTVSVEFSIARYQVMNQIKANIYMRGKKEKKTNHVRKQQHSPLANNQRPTTFPLLVPNNMPSEPTNFHA
jgi:hypothetical protein